MIKFFIKFIFLAGLALGAWFFYGVLSDNELTEDKVFVIAEGQGVNEISANLYEQDLIKNKFIFETWLWLKKIETKMNAGTYTVKAGTSVRQLSNLFLIGTKEKEQASFTILEGWNRNEIAKALDKKNISGNDFLKLTESVGDWREHYDFLADAPNNATLEGFIFPNTHYINKNTIATDIIEKTLVDFGKKLTSELRTEIKRQGKTIFEVVTLASIVEKEVPVYADKKMIADIFLKRLDANIGLQSDATVNFVTGKSTPQATLDDLKNESPYNTYKWRGLPPGPISNPGIESIEAVIYPTSNSYYYFLTTSDGEVIYSKDYEEHLANKRKYLD